MLKRIQKSLVSKKYLAARLFSAFIINVSWAANQHIKMISVGSCDTDDWSNDALHPEYVSGVERQQFPLRAPSI